MMKIAFNAVNSAVEGLTALEPLSGGLDSN